MITKTDCMTLLADLSSRGINTVEATKALVKAQEPTLEVLKFINDNRQMDLVAFYEKLRKSYNDKKSKLYINIMKDDIPENITDVITTLNSYALQASLFASKLEDKQLFLRFSRLDEVYKCLAYYIKTYDLTPCIKLISLIKADIKVLETIYR